MHKEMVHKDTASLLKKGQVLFLKILSISQLMDAQVKVGAQEQNGYPRLSIFSKTCFGACAPKSWCLCTQK